MAPARPSATGSAFVLMSATTETRFASAATAVTTGGVARNAPGLGAVMLTVGASRSAVYVKLVGETAPPISVTSTSSVASPAASGVVNGTTIEQVSAAAGAVA